MNIKQAKQLWKDSPHDDELIDLFLKMDDKFWNQMIEGATKNTQYFKEWMVATKEQGWNLEEYNDSLDDKWNPKLIFMNMLIEAHKDQVKNPMIFLLPMFMLMHSDFRDTWLAYQAMKQVKVYIINK